MILQQQGEKTYAAYWNADYSGQVQPCREYFHKLVEGLNAQHADLPVPVRMIPAGEVLARLDPMIRLGKLPGIEAFYKRNQPYYIKARGQVGRDVVVCGNDLAAKRDLAKNIEKAANGSYKRCPPHANAGPDALPHYQPNPRPPAGHTFYETTNRKAK